MYLKIAKGLHYEGFGLDLALLREKVVEVERLLESSPKSKQVGKPLPPCVYTKP